MNKKTVMLATLLLIASGAASAKSTKRGVCHNQYRDTQALELLKPGVSWWYSWGTTPPTGNDYYDYNGLEFIPMLWADYHVSDNNLEKIRTYCKSHPEVKYLLGFNEPNFKGQADMTPQEAAAEWPKVQALAKELGLQIVAPALNYSPDAPYQDPLKWMQEFTDLVGKDAYDFTAVHAYGGTGVCQKIAGDFHDRFGKPVWLTEFCYWPNESGYQSPATQIRFMQEVVGWLETTPWIYRYAWFMATGASDSDTGPNFGLVKEDMDPTTMQFYGYKLTRQGLYYTYLPGYDPTQVMQDNRFYNANYCVGYNGVQWSEPVAGSEYGAPLTTTSISTEGFLDYLFNAPESGDYNVRIDASGYGEPNNFDTILSIYDIDDDMNETELAKDIKIDLPNSDTERVGQNLPITLTAGQHRIRIKQTGRTSGMILHGLTIATAAGIETIGTESDANTPVEYFNLQGARIADPTSGQIVIRRQGSESVKMVIR